MEIPPIPKEALKLNEAHARFSGDPAISKPNKKVKKIKAYFCRKKVLKILITFLVYFGTWGKVFAELSIKDYFLFQLNFFLWRFFTH